MIDAVMYGMMPRAKIVRRLMLPPAKRSKKPKIDPAFELKNSSHRVILIPGVGMCPPRRYTASRPSANRSRLRRSGTRNIFANASNSLFMSTLRFPTLFAFFFGRAQNLRRAAHGLDFLQRGFGKMMGFHRD